MKLGLIQGIPYLLIASIGFYFGRIPGALFLVIIAFLLFHYPKLKKQFQQKKEGYDIDSNDFDLAWAYSLLNVTEHSTEEELITAKKRLLNIYHPDKLKHASHQQKQSAEEKVNQIHRAFELIQKYRKSNH